MKFTAYQSLPKLSTSMKLVPSTASFIESILKHKLLGKCFCGSGNAIYLGAPMQQFLIKDKHVLENHIQYRNCLYYKRILYKRKIYKSVMYCADTTRNDSCVMLSSGEFALVHNFIVLPDRSLLVDLQNLKLRSQPIVSGQYVKIRHIKLVEGIGERVCLTIDSIHEPSFLISSGGYNFVSRLPYGCTVE